MFFIFVTIWLVFCIVYDPLSCHSVCFSQQQQQQILLMTFLTH